jgi:hypothetical protein
VVIPEGITCECRWDGVGCGGIKMTSKARFGICETRLRYIGGRSSPFPLHTIVNDQSACMMTIVKTTNVL